MNDRKIKYFSAKVLSNIPIGESSPASYFKLEFEAFEMQNLTPGQFIMVDTGDEGALQSISNKSSYVSAKDISCFGGIIKKQAFLKRPFGISGVYHGKSGYEAGALSQTKIPGKNVDRSSRFEVIYKIIEAGTGTNELKLKKEGDVIHVLGPLGKPVYLSEWKEKGINEVHLIGGGVGMAPLIFFAQTLMRYSFRIKVFFGVDSLRTLVYRIPSYGQTEESYEKYHIFIDQLLRAGVDKKDIFLSTEENVKDEIIFRKIIRANYRQGFVTGQYESYLAENATQKGLMALACGPEPMMMELKKITSQFRVPARVLMEKRMGCGIGVCMSCVCKTKSNGKEQYSRVCVDGPLFDLNDMVWN